MYISTASLNARETSLNFTPLYLSYLRTAVSIVLVGQGKACATWSGAVLRLSCFVLTSRMIKDLLWSFSSPVHKLFTWFTIWLLWRYLWNLTVLLVSSLVVQVVIHFCSIATDYLYTHRSTPKIMSCIVTLALETYTSETGLQLTAPLSLLFPSHLSCPNFTATSSWLGRPCTWSNLELSLGS